LIGAKKAADSSGDPAYYAARQAAERPGGGVALRGALLHAIRHPADHALSVCGEGRCGECGHNGDPKFLLHHELHPSGFSPVTWPSDQFGWANSPFPAWFRAWGKDAACLRKSDDNDSAAFDAVRPSVSGHGSVRKERFARPAMTTIRLHQNDLPDDVSYGDSVAIDTETLGLLPHRDRLCVVQLSGGDGAADVVQIAAGQRRAPNIERLLADPKVTKLFHYARFDIAVLFNTFSVMASPVYCTKIASKLVRTYTDRHGLKDLARELLSVDMSKQQQSSDWGAAVLSEAQLAYAASDVLHLHALRSRLDAMLIRENRLQIAQECFRFLPARARLDLLGWAETDIFSHQ
jgi:ribonuclease D